MKIKVRGYKLMVCMVLAAISLTAFVIHTDIVLLDEPLPFKPNGFYIEKVIDERHDQISVAVIAVVDKNLKPVLKEADLQGGAAAAISGFIARNLTASKSAPPVSMAIRDIRLTETVLPNGSIEGKVTLSLSFGQLKNYGIQELVNYNGSSRYVRRLGDEKFVETRLRSIITSGLVYFNNWMGINLPGNPKLAKAVKFSFSDYSDKIGRAHV